MLSVSISLLVTFVILVYVHYLKTYRHWKSRGVQCVKPLFPIIGNVYDIFLLRPALNIILRIYKASDAPFYGCYVFSKPVLIVKDPDLIKQILITDFNNFVDRGFTSNPDVDPVAKNIIHFKEQDWKAVRPKLVSCLKVNRIKNMMTTMNENATLVMRNLNTKYKEGVKCELLDLSYRFMVDSTLRTLFGINSNCIQNPSSEFYIISKNILGIHFIKHVFTGIFSPWLYSVCGITMCSSKNAKFFKNAVCDNVKFRESVKSNSNDLFHTLMQMKKQYESAIKENKTVDGPEIDDNFIAGQVFMFLTAGFESPGNTMAFCMYELTQNKEVQERLYKEIKTVLAQYDDQITYDSIQDMKYLNQVLAETMRKYPALSLIFRQCTKSYKIPETDVTIDAGTLVLIPVHGIHYDVKYYPEPEAFNPDRFNDANRTNIHPGTYLPFGIGPRNCPATLYSNIIMKIFIVRILKVYEISLSEKTKVPIGFNPLQFVLTPEKSGVWLKLEKRVP